MKYSLQILLLIIIGHLNAQQVNCSFVNDYFRFFQNQNDYNNFLLNKEKIISAFDENLDLRDEITIPVVFHVFNKKNSDFQVRIPDVYEQLDILNDAFNAQNYDLKYVPDTFYDLIGNLRINFCIGKKDESGKVIKGILFFETEENNFADQYVEGDNKRLKIKHKSFGGSDLWDPQKYINIWIGEMSNNFGTSTFPGINPEYSNEEGIVINIGNLKKNSTQKKTIVHEMGHYFDLYHIWGNNPGCENDDEVEDTPLQYNYYSGCPKGDKFSCGSMDMFMNYMDYTNDHCSLMFTKGQIERMKASINIYRKSLIINNSLCDIKIVTDLFDGIDFYVKNNCISLVRTYFPDEVINVIIYDIRGREIYSGKFGKWETVKNISSVYFNSGLYFIQLNSGKIVNTKKIIIF